jgi:predicted DNA-binding protein (MmcQ/YjbR family)
MNIEEIREFALNMFDVEESCPFGPNTLVFKTNLKMFLLLPLDKDQLKFNVKCKPEIAIALREKYPTAVLPGYHMSKKHWNTIVVNGQISQKEMKEFIVESYQLVARKMR